MIDGKVEKKDKTQGALYPVYIELNKLSEANKRFSKKKLKEAVDFMTVEFDKIHKYSLLRKVMLSENKSPKYLSEMV